MDSVVKPALGNVDKVNARIAKAGETVLGSNQPIRKATAAYYGAKGGTGNYLKNRQSNLVSMREADLDANDSITNWLKKDGALQKGASLFFEGDTGMLSKTRIAGVGAGVAGTGYAVFGGDDD